MNLLFRKEVLKNFTGHSHGTVFLSLPISNIVLSCFLSFLFSGALLFIVFGEYAKKERVRGYLAPNKGVISIVPQKTGVILETYFQNGDQVALGQNLFLVKVDTASGVGGEVAAGAVSGYKAEKNELIALRDLQPSKHKITTQRIKARIKGNEAKVVKLADQIEFQRLRVRNQEIMLEKFQGLLNNDAASTLEVISRENSVIEASKELGRLSIEFESLNSETLDLRSELALLPISKEENIRKLTNQINSIDQLILRSQSEQTYYVTAPVSGRLASLTAQVGQTASSQRVMGSIIPEGGTLVAKLLVPSRASGFVSNGQSVRLLFDSFPYQKFGFQSGEVFSISRASVSRSQIPIEIEVPGPVFLVDVEMDNQNIKLSDVVYDMQPGMTISADIILEERKLWEWVLEPLLSGNRR